ncbi:MAT1-1-1 [Thelonectria olida]|uniref:MAT1-1-1 n=1 Tax=Thelonectria olida TaxID=1576542 RepID=A0A9P8VVA4_9HYPO|nr:MAT1-1-1 [Thelonectria olida]
MASLPKLPQELTLKSADVKERLMRRLKNISALQLLSIVDDDVFFAVAANWFKNMPEDLTVSDQPNIAAASIPANPPAQAAANGSGDRPQRPLNAFMAFRTYYLRLFPEAQQKIASGFLTTLWGKEPFRNKWALIAKVYSFARDEVGKCNISLGGFLAICCPIMNIVDPSVYLPTLGWVLREDGTGSQILVQDPAVTVAPTQIEVVPSTEIELLKALLNTGYLSQQGYRLMERLCANTNGIMTTSTLPVETPYLITQEKLDFTADAIVRPREAAEELVGPNFNLKAFDQYPPRLFQVHNMSEVSNAMMARPHPTQWAPYYDTNIGLRIDHTFQFSAIKQTDPVDNDNPREIDLAVGHVVPELSELGITGNEGNNYVPQQDFHYLIDG